MRTVDEAVCMPHIWRTGSFFMQHRARVCDDTMQYGSHVFQEDSGNRRKETMSNPRTSARTIAMTGMLSAIAFILMYLQFNVPLMPNFIAMDLSELPALIGSFAMGPVQGIIICLVKNLLHLTRTSTGGVGELSNFILGAIFVGTAGFIYKKNKTKKAAVIGAFSGAIAMAIMSVVTNYFIVYPVYTNFMPMEAIIAAYQVINPHVNTLLECLIIFNLPFTFIKGMLSVLITLLVYKRLSPIIKGTQHLV